MVVIFLIGTAGSGKSLLTASLNDWLRVGKQKSITVNLDPGVTNLPYAPDIDIRNKVNLDQIMQDYKLGPNGALVLAADLIAEETQSIAAEIEDLQSDVVLVDTPGQMELFAFRASGPYIANELTDQQKAIVYLFDAVFSFNPLNYISNMFLSAAVYNRFYFPQLHALSKCDLLPEEETKRIVSWSSDPDALESAIDEKLTGTRRLLSLDIIRAIHRLGLEFELIPVSGKTNEGLINLSSVLERILVGGEKFTM
ncbi:MAG: ATP/GTP-binding protein [Candidatus Bathyarchaeota archaeon]|nr:ATP/GTP-binding protein [Candidatus Bathyarchaeota archaeon]